MKEKDNMKSIDKTLERLMEMIEKLSNPPYTVGQGYNDWYEKELKRRSRIHEKNPEFNPSINLDKTMALYNERHPTGNPEVDSHWKTVRDMVEQLDPLERIYNDWGICEECGYEGPIHEIGLTWSCDNPKCVNAINEGYDSYFKFHKELWDRAADDFKSVHIEIRDRIIKRAMEKGVPILQEWVSCLEDFANILSDNLGISIEDARSKIPELIANLKNGSQNFPLQ